MNVGKDLSRRGYGGGARKAPMRICPMPRKAVVNAVNLFQSESLPMLKRNDMDIQGMKLLGPCYALFLRSRAHSCSTMSPTRRRSGSVSFSRTCAIPCARSSSRGEPLRSRSSSGQESASAISDNRPSGGSVAPRSKREIPVNYSLGTRGTSQRNLLKQPTNTTPIWMQKR